LPSLPTPRNGRDGTGGGFTKPPKSQVKVRPATAAGVLPSPVGGGDKGKDRAEDAERDDVEGEGRVSPSGLALPLVEPESRTPSPPPEPVAAEERVVVKQEELEESVHSSS
jgi:hypothetical protein